MCWFVIGGKFGLGLFWRDDSVDFFDGWYWVRYLDWVGEERMVYWGNRFGEERLRCWWREDW